MKFTVWEKREVEVPDEKLLGLAASIRKRFSMKKDEPVYAEDLLAAAEDAGLVWLAGQYRIDDERFTDEELGASR